MYVAIYLPVLPPNKPQDPSRKGFPTENSAWEYVFSNLCSMCKEVREAALSGRTEWVANDKDYGSYPPTLYPACCYEWEVVEGNDLEKEELENIISI